LQQAMFRMRELETLAKMYYLALAVGRPVVLSDAEIMHTVERFKSYGVGLQQRSGEAKGKTPASPDGVKRVASKSGGKRKPGTGKSKPK